MPAAAANRDARPRSALHQSFSSMQNSLAMQNRDCKHCLDAAAYDLAMHIGQTLKKVMKERGVAPADMAVHCGVSRGAVSNWFSTGRITKANLVKAAGLLEVTVEDLVAGDLGERTSQPLAPLPLASLADDTMTLLSVFNQLDAFKRAKVIRFALDQGNASLEPTGTEVPHKLSKQTRKRSLSDRGLPSKTLNSGSSAARPRRDLK